MIALSMRQRASKGIGKTFHLNVFSEPSGSNATITRIQINTAITGLHSSLKSSITGGGR
jgi:hypothetical protein